MTPLLAQRPRSDRAFERLYKRHVGDVYRYALAVMRNPADAEDVTQTTFLNAYRAYAEKGSRPEKPQNWLIAIAHNVCRQRFRQSARRPAEVSFEDDIADTVPTDDAPTGDDIRRALGHLAFNQRAALVMRELEGRSYVEIAEILEVSTSAVETLIFRARRALREQLEESLTCGDAEFAISRQLDGRLGRHERGQLRAHLRECAECAAFARRQRAHRGALKALAFVPLPSSLTSFFGGGSGAAVGTGLALKTAAAVTAGMAIGGASYEGVQHAHRHTAKPTAVVSQQARVAVAAPAPASVSVSRRAVADAGSRSHIATRSASKAHGHAARTARVGVGPKAKPAKVKKSKAHGHANNARAARPVTLAAHGRGAQQAHRVHPSHSATTQKKPQEKPRPQPAPGPATEHSTPASAHGK
jgi:RNA polymerase sigma factor (sigma-70 family)